MKNAILVGVALLALSLLLCACGSNPTNTPESRSTDSPKNDLSIKDFFTISDFQKGENLFSDVFNENKNQDNGSKSESDIKNDLIQSDIWKSMYVEVTDFQIVKRQTTPEQKIDTVYVMVAGENDDYMCVRNYVMEYELYNEGWLLEKIESYEAAQNLTVPLHGVQESVLNSEIETYDNPTFPNALISSQRSEFSVILSNIESGTEQYEFSKQYEYEYIIETKTVTLTYVFEYLQWNLVGMTETSDVVFKENILGTWETIFNVGPSARRGSYECDYLIIIDEVDGNRCHISADFTETPSANNNRRLHPNWQSIELDFDEDGNPSYIVGTVLFGCVIRMLDDGLLYYKPNANSYSHLYTKIG